MKPAKLLLSIIAIASAVLLAGGAASAQTSFAAPKEHGANFHVTAGGVLMRAGGFNNHVISNFVDSPTTPIMLNIRGDAMSMYGASVTFGWRIDRHNKIQMEASVVGGRQEVWLPFSPSPYGQPPYGQPIKTDYTMGMDLFTYDFCVPFGRKGICEFHLAPSVGAAYIYSNSIKQSCYTSVSPVRVQSSGVKNFTYAAGVGAGLTFHVTKRVQLDLCYRYLRMGKIDHKWSVSDSSHIEFEYSQTLAPHSVTFSAGWKF